MSVTVSSLLRVLITSGMIWCDIGPVWLVEPILYTAFQFRIIDKVDGRGLSKIACCTSQARTLKLMPY